MGRFAPSPTGSLHLGSLTTAVASYLDARAHGGRWIVRVEDLDTPRVQPGKADEILRTLEAHGLEWDGPVIYQSRRREVYQAGYDRLRALGRLYPCVCSRRVMQSESPGEPYSGRCRTRVFEESAAQGFATRLRLPTGASACWQDRFLGPQNFTAARIGDVILRRRDGIFAYHFAVVVDDAAQGVTSIVRGSDLLSATAWQILIQRELGLPEPAYGHTPILTETDGSKLAKSRRSTALGMADATQQLVFALGVLGQPPPVELRGAPPRELLDYAGRAWNPARFQGIQEVPLAKNFVPGGGCTKVCGKPAYGGM